MGLHDIIFVYSRHVEHYNSYIQSNPELELAGIFAYDGINGTNTKKRDEFNRMIEECLNGKIDMIITKSITNFGPSPIVDKTTLL